MTTKNPPSLLYKLGNSLTVSLKESVTASELASVAVFWFVVVPQEIASFLAMTGVFVTANELASVAVSLFTPRDCFVPRNDGQGRDCFVPRNDGQGRDCFVPRNDGGFRHCERACECGSLSFYPKRLLRASQ